MNILSPFLSGDDIALLRRLCCSTHGEDKHEKVGRIGRPDKLHILPWLAARIQAQIHVAVGRVDDHMQIYRIRGAVPLHVDEDFPGEGGMVARYSVLLRLNDDYEGGETRIAWETVDIPVGGGIIFPHDLPHEGLAVRAGAKLMVKTDLFVH